MSWVKELLESTSNIKDPFLKFLLRLTYLLLLIVIGYLAFSLITGKKIHWGAGEYEITNGSQTDLKDKKQDSLNKSNDSVSTSKTMLSNEKEDSLKRVSGPPNSSEALLENKKTDSIKQTTHSIDAQSKIVNKKTVDTNNAITHQQTNDKVLTSTDKRQILRLIDSISENDVYQKINVSIYWREYDDISENCATELKNFMSFKGFYIDNFRAYHTKGGTDFTIHILTPSLQYNEAMYIKVGRLSSGDRTYKLE